MTAVDHVTTHTDARGNVTSFDFYDNELPWKITRTDRGGTPRVTTFEHDADNRLWKTTDPRNGVETRLYWPDGQLKSIESAAGRKSSYAYDSAGQLTTLVEPNGNAPGATASDWTWTYGYDDAGNRTSEAHPDGGTRSTVYDALNRPTQLSDPLSHVSTLEYDANGNLTRSVDPLTHERTYTYDKLDRRKTETDERGKTTTHAYYASGELESTTTALGHKTTYALDDDGRLASSVEPRGNVTGGTPADYRWTYTYDQAGNRTQVADPLGNHTDYAYNEHNQPTSISDQRGNATLFSYDVLNRLWKVTPPAAGATGTLDTVYDYDPAGNLATRTDPNGHATNWTYDLDGQATQRTDPVGTWNYTWDANGNLKTTETAAGSSTGTVGDGTITHSYDRMNRLTAVDYSDSTPDVSRTYDAAGRLTTMSDGIGSVTYLYDNADRLTDITRTNGGAGHNGTFHYDYDSAANITGRTVPDATTVSQTFDDDGHLTAVTSGGQTTAFAYDAAGNLTTTTLPSGNGHVETRSFDRAGRLTTTENAKAGTILSKFAWTLDPAGNPTKAQTTRGTTDTYDAYEYDARNRLTASCYGVLSSATNCSGAANLIGYAYDKVSSRTQEIRSGSVGNTGTIDYAYNAADQLTSTSKSGATTNYAYDANGNQTSNGSRTDVYDLANRLTSSTTGGTTTSYSYDGDGLRASAATAGGTDLRFRWDPLAESGIPELALERDSSGALVRRYLGGLTGALSFNNGSGTFWYHRDPLGSVTDVTDASGAAQWRYEYEAYGAQRTATNVSGTAPTSPLRFQGQHLDEESSLYHLRARQYDPVIGRFTALDPVENPLLQPYTATYMYVAGQPTVFIDPFGLSRWNDAWKRTKKFAGGAREFGGELAHGVGQFARDPIGTARATGRMTVATYHQYGGGWEGALMAFNQFNPVYHLLNDGGACLAAITAGDAHAIGYSCTSTAFGAATLGAGGVGVRALCAPRSIRAAKGGFWHIDDVIDAATQVRGKFPRTGNPNEILVRRNPVTGAPTHYQVYGPDGLPIKRVDITGRAHGGVSTPHVVEFEQHKNPQTGQVFVRPQRHVRPARPEEIPGG